MENTEIIEGNKLIAEATGWKLYTPKYKGMFMSFFNKYDTECYELNGYTRAYTPDKMKYHLSWDWLMPVCKMIASENEIYSAGITATLNQNNFETLPVWITVVQHLKIKRL